MDSTTGITGADSRRIAVSRSEIALVALISLVCAYCFFGEYLPPNKRVYLWSDIAGYHYPLQAYAFNTLKQWRFPSWDASIYCGISFAGNVQTALFYPLTWLLYAAAWPGDALRFKALEVFALAHVWIAFLLCYRWLRGRCGPMASALGALVFSASGFMTYELLHLGVLGATTWLPLGFLALDQADSRRDWRPLWKLAAASALAFLAGYPASWLVNCVVWLVYALMTRAPWRAAAGACVALAGSMILTAVQLLPTMEARALMLVEPKYGPGAWSAKTLLLAYLLPNWFDFNPGHPTNYDPGCIYFYAGLPTLFALFWAVRQHKWRPYLQPLVCLAAVFLLANPPALLLHAVEHIPALDRTMQPFNFYGGAAPMVALITALGLEDYLSRGAIAAKKLPSKALRGVLLLVAAWCFRQLLISDRGGMFPTHSASVAATAIALAVFCFCLWGFRRSAGRVRSLFAVLVLLTTVVDYKVYSSGRWFNAMPGDNDDLQPPHKIPGMNAEAYAALRANRSYRIMCDEFGSPYSTELRKYELASPQGFDPFLPVQYRQWIERSIPFRTNRVFFLDIHKEAMLRSLGVRYIITHEGSGSDPYLAHNPEFRLLGPDDSFYRVYEWLDAKAPYYWADHEDGSARPVRWLPERRDLEVSSQEGGKFVLVEQFFPGWRATVDGRAVGIDRFDSTFQSIVVPPGEHRLTFEYRPVSLIVGACLSALALAAMLAIAFSEWRASRSQQSHDPVGVVADR